MRTVNPYSHYGFLCPAFFDMLPKDSFAGKIKRTIGANLDDLLDLDAEFDNSGMRASDPVRSIFFWLSSGETMGIDWLVTESGDLYADNGELIKPEDIRPLTKAEQMAAYGEWLILDDMGTYGSSAREDLDENGRNEDGWDGWEIKWHKAECFLLAYQALAYAQRLLAGEKLTAEESKKASEVDYSAMGRSGANKRHAIMNSLKLWTIDRYKAGTWRDRNISANAAAHEMKAEVLKQSAAIGANMKEYSAQNTIAAWIRKLV